MPPGEEDPGLGGDPVWAPVPTPTPKPSVLPVVSPKPTPTPTPAIIGLLKNDPPTDPPSPPQEAVAATPAYEAPYAIEPGHVDVSFGFQSLPSTTGDRLTYAAFALAIGGAICLFIGYLPFLLSRKRDRAVNEQFIWQS